jgi:hypothetical protein
MGVGERDDGGAKQFLFLFLFSALGPTKGNGRDVEFGDCTRAHTTPVRAIHTTGLIRMSGGS